jgi:hypothetical protein
MDGGLWHQTGGRPSGKSPTAKVGAVLGAAVPIGVVAARLWGRRRRPRPGADGTGAVGPGAAGR